MSPDLVEERRARIGARRRRRRWTIATAMLVGAIAVGASAQAYLYVPASGQGSRPIARYDLDGNNRVPDFVNLTNPAYAVTVNGGHIYYTYTGSNSIGRADIDGKPFDNKWLDIGLGNSFGLAVDAHHIYWTYRGKADVGRANLDGTNIDRTYINGPNDAHSRQIATDGARLYWVVDRGDVGGQSTVARANADGSHVNLKFIDNAGPLVWGVGLSDSHAYWTHGYSIGRAQLDGDNVNRDFIDTKVRPGSPAQGIAVGDRRLYWVDDAGNLGRAGLDGDNVRKGLADSRGRYAIAADDRGPGTF